MSERAYEPPEGITPEQAAVYWRERALAWGSLLAEASARNRGLATDNDNLDAAVAAYHEERDRLLGQINSLVAAGIRVAAQGA